MSEELCTNCGAPRAAGYAACKFCKTPFVANTQTNAIPCPRCATLNELGAQKCVQCQTWVVVQCVFCHALSPHNAPACLHCSEAFAGAPERFAARQSEQRLAQGLNIAGTVGNVAASFLGAAAGVGMFSGHHEHHHAHHSGYGSAPGGDWNESNSGGNLGIEQSSGGGGGFFDSLFGSSSSDSSGNLSTESGDSGGGGFFDSSSDDSGDSSDTSDDDS
jgi:hypothetical protein